MLNLEFNLKPSRQTLSFLTVLILASSAIMLTLSLPIWLRFAGILCIMSYGSHLFWQYGLLRSQNSIISLKRVDDSWHIVTQKKAYKGELLGESTISGVTSLLRFRLDDTPQFMFNRPRTCLIFPDSLARGQYRQLLVTVRMG
jgi:hypothetical protein